jgi:hypothetical protein
MMANWARWKDLESHVGAHVDEDAGALLRGHDPGQGGPVDARDAADGEHAAGHHRAGFARADHAVGLAFLDQAAGHLDGGILLAAQGLGRFFVHAHHLGGVDDMDVQTLGLASREFVPDLGLVADQDDRRALLGRAHGGRNVDARSEIAAHGVDGDAWRLTEHHRRASPCGPCRCHTRNRRDGTEWVRRTRTK